MSAMRLTKLQILAGLLSLLASGAMADMFQPTPYCSKPNKPYKFTSQWELDSFRSDVETYKSCILRFVREQQEASKKHMDAAGEAIDAWNSFVRNELNR